MLSVSISYFDGLSSPWALDLIEDISSSGLVTESHTIFSRINNINVALTIHSRIRRLITSFSLALRVSLPHSRDICKFYRYFGLTGQHSPPLHAMHFILRSNTQNFSACFNGRLVSGFSKALLPGYISDEHHVSSSHS
jgi:hypothetical protein